MIGTLLLYDETCHSPLEPLFSSNNGGLLNLMSILFLLQMMTFFLVKIVTHPLSTACLTDSKV